ncbi:DUF3750 domain-containing protein [uncultured Nisaea sp.]|jgi:uncharacterized protein DUF3750|uniref:DUF3750 domain-containing protein n=1 Tax=uncultured Nisaea sp. TaxID=538215 RepID=UPI0030EB6535|tara:strand:+ start:268 stop:1038 length:771 start_codon:yes stop_codon:yes gene_type:complete
MARSRTLFKRITLFGLVLVGLLGLPLAASAVGKWAEGPTHWSQARRDSAEIAPPAATTPEAVIQVYAARAWSWRGIFGVHTWISAKQPNADHYMRFEVMGWQLRRSDTAVRVTNGNPDGYWFGSKPELLRDIRGPEAEALIPRIAAAAQSYPHAGTYRVWPGPNSNTFTAHIARQVPELRLDLPPTAVGKDFIPEGGLFAKAPSGTGYQLSLYGLAGVMLALEEGVEVNMLGLTLGIDLKNPALKLPGVGRIGMPD